MKVKSLRRVRPSATPWTAAHQALPSMGFSRREDWSGCHRLLQGHVQYPAFAPDAVFLFFVFVFLLWLLRSGSWVFCLYLLV